MRRRLLPVLAAMPLLAGCLVVDDPIGLALHGPRIDSASSPAARRPEPGDRMALLLLDPGENAASLGPCIATGMRARLPEGWPAPELPEDADTVAGLVAVARAAEQDGALPESPIATHHAWLVAVLDRSSAGAVEERAEGFGQPGSIGVAMTHTRRYRLELEARLLDLRTAQRIGRLVAVVDTRRREGVAVGVFAGAAGVLPLALPLVEFPAGTSALAICDAFGRAVAAALVEATEPVPDAVSAPTAAPP